MTQKTLIIGAGSEIGRALLKLHRSLGENPIAVQRSAEDSNSISLQEYTEENIESFCQSHIDKLREVNTVYVCIGVLHQLTANKSEQSSASDAQRERFLFRPEKALSQLEPETLALVNHINTTIPMMWLKHLSQAFGKQQAVKLMFFSARVGSISDNRLGGWYSYRMSKAALNMALKCASIELARTHKQLKLISYHPGTTDTPLSKPFQANVPQEQLFSAEKSAEYCFQVLNAQKLDQTLSYVDWQGKSIPY